MSSNEGFNGLRLPLPPSANVYWRYVGGRPLVSSEARAYKQAAGWLALAAGIEPMDGALALTLDVTVTRSNADLSNRIKVIEDALNGIAYHDDKQIVELHCYRRVAREGCVIVSLARATERVLRIVE